MYSKRVAQGMNGSIGVDGEFEAAVFEAFDLDLGFMWRYLRGVVTVFFGSSWCLFSKAAFFEHKGHKGFSSRYELYDT